VSADLGAHCGVAVAGERPEDRDARRWVGRHPAADQWGVVRGEPGEQWGRAGGVGSDPAADAPIGVGGEAGQLAGCGRGLGVPVARRGDDDWRQRVRA
jgi:hypothetical protein